MNQPQIETNLNTELMKSIKNLLKNLIDHFLMGRVETAIALEEVASEIRQKIEERAATQHH
ncbi:hypothetical protein C7B65_15210 [Phormidesmis priestleyi ULC007]|uniref:Uncharacterized protein n=1 Tax=Phormidesmis priestleyi ULC007 TaxID=1920490 RepID=A0A2T1DDC8_9CYAN|nr:hypothetical protein [Phormidesmis priestleyi]PSB18441.1 hypothetical protein C7B65_15210 [Phormidesmis priestleyi ULC007]PZO48832.1 MAG: hypothetical protein DCF14_15980 [Phormidesmis priestleyi]